MLADGRADGLIAHDLGRAVRDPRDLEDRIERRRRPPPHRAVTTHYAGDFAWRGTIDVASIRIWLPPARTMI